jgi:hypothetical protein
MSSVLCDPFSEATSTIAIDTAKTHTEKPWLLYQYYIIFLEYFQFLDSTGGLSYIIF